MNQTTEHFSENQHASVEASMKDVNILKTTGRFGSNFTTTNTNSQNAKTSGFGSAEIVMVDSKPSLV